MKSLIFFATVLLLVASSNVQAQTTLALMPSEKAAVFKNYCYDCHDSDTQEGSVDLESIPLEISKDIETAELEPDGSSLFDHCSITFGTNLSSVHTLKNCVICG